MKRTRAALPAAAIIALVSAVDAGTAAAQATGDKPTVAGAWTLNVEKSDDVRERMAAAMRNRGRQPEGLPQRGGVTVGTGARGARGGAAGVVEPPPGAGASQTPGGMAMLQSARSLRIEFGEGTVALYRDELPPLELKMDGTARVEGPEGHHIEYRAKWNGSRLEVETRADGGPRVTEAYTLDGKDPAILAVDVRVTMPGPDGTLNVRLKRAYDRG